MNTCKLQVPQPRLEAESGAVSGFCAAVPHSRAAVAHTGVAVAGNNPEGVLHRLVAGNVVAHTLEEDTPRALVAEHPVGEGNRVEAGCSLVAVVVVLHTLVLEVDKLQEAVGNCKREVVGKRWVVVHCAVEHWVVEHLHEHMDHGKDPCRGLGTDLGLDLDRDLDTDHGKGPGRDHGMDHGRLAVEPRRGLGEGRCIEEAC